MHPENLLLEPYQLNSNIALKNKIVMAPMTRSKADDHLVPTKQMAEYYARRSDAGLIITEGTIIRPDGLGYPNVPGIFTQAQIDGWRQVTDRVHEHDGKIFMQIWHVGRVSHPNFLHGKLPISPSETFMKGHVSRSPGLTYDKSRAVTVDEIQELIESYATAAKNAIAAGFDGIELHGANGYLIDQFLHYHTNHRTDHYGLTPENMARFALEVIKACGDVIGYEKVGIRLSPGGYLNEIVSDVRDVAVFQYLFEQLNLLNIAYVHTGNFNDSVVFPELEHKTMTNFMRTYFKGTLIASGSYTLEAGEEGLRNNHYDLVAIGRPFIANPDLISRFKNKMALEAYDVSMLGELY